MPPRLFRVRNVDSMSLPEFQTKCRKLEQRSPRFAFHYAFTFVDLAGF
jgi:hypothetical protein